MSPWVIVAALTALGALVVTVAVRRTVDEVEPTVRAFADFRAALRPAVAGLRADARETRARLVRQAGSADADRL
ncbi:MAG: hypothetical protein M5U14_05975 [Acidimicrobiia bacterium]|nr:hypothetical protein [Acidimicrobiia bacterium]